MTRRIPLRNNGFTFFEIMMVVTIIAILSVAALPLLSGSSDRAAELETARIEATIRRAQVLARSLQKEYQVVFSTTDGTISVSETGAVIETQAAASQGASVEVGLSGSQSVTLPAQTGSASKSKVIPEGGSLSVLTQAAESTVDVEEGFVCTLDEGVLTSVDFDSKDTMYVDTKGEVTVGGTLQVDYGDLTVKFDVATKTGAITVTETRK